MFYICFCQFVPIFHFRLCSFIDEGAKIFLPQGAGYPSDATASILRLVMGTFFIEIESQRISFS